MSPSDHGRTGLVSYVRERTRNSLWPLPVLAIGIAVALGAGLPALDGMLGEPGGDHPLRFAFGGGPSAARDVLAVIAGSLISVTGLTFSFTVVALQLSSSQHSPRLLQTFVTDRVVQVTLAQLVGTFVYALTVLRTVRAEDSASGADAFVPRLSVTVGFGLALVSVVALVLFLAHLARSLRVETMLRDVHDEARRAFDGELTAEGTVDAAPEPVPGAATPACVDSSGFVVDVDPDPIVRAARAADVVVVLCRRIGDSVVAGTPVAHVWPRRPGGTADLDGIERSLARGVRLAFERSPTRDIAYSLRKVVDIAVRALSPGTNDPTTAVHALSHVSALLCDLATRPLQPSCFADSDGVVRLRIPQWDIRALLQLGLEEPLQFASGQPAVLRRTSALIREVAWRAPRGDLDEDLAELHDQVVRLARRSTSVPEAETDRWRRQVQDALSGRWTPEA